MTNIHVIPLSSKRNFLSLITLQDEKTIDCWSIAIEGGQGKDEQVYKDTEVSIKESKAPGISVERVKVRTSWLKGLLGKGRT